MIKQSIKMVSAATFICCLFSACSLPTIKMDAERQSFREALVQTLTLGNMTVDAKASITENGAVIFAGDNHMEWDAGRAYMAGPITLNDQILDMEGVWAEGSFIYRVDSNYKSFKPRESMMRNMSKRAPKMTDYIIAKILRDMPGDFTEESGNVIVSLQEADIPADWNKKMNTMLTSMVEWSEEETLRNIFIEYFGEAALFQLPITGNARILSMTSASKVEEGIVTNISLGFIIAGTDNTGAERVISLDCAASVSHIGSTMPASIDVEGKNVTPITKEEYKALRRAMFKLGWRLM